MGHKRNRRSKKNRFPAEMPPTSPSEKGCEKGPIRWYETPARARAAQKAAFAQFNGRQAKRRASQNVSPFSNREWTINRNESKFIDWLAEARPNAQVQRGGWPDFILETENHEIVCVEVKSNQDSLSDDQRRCNALLERAGIKCFVWTPKGKIQRANEFLSEAGRRPPVLKRPEEPTEGCTVGMQEPCRHATQVPDEIQNPSEITPTRH